MDNGERQWTSRLSGIRPDHRFRYEWAASVIPRGSIVLDLCAGIGYGSYILAEAGHVVRGIELSAPAVKYGREHWDHERAELLHGDVLFSDYGHYDYAIAFECIEHLRCPIDLLRRIDKPLLCSVPNAEVIPFDPQAFPFHLRHYTPGQFRELLRHRKQEEFHQLSKKSPVEPGFTGRTLILKTR